MVAVSHVLCYCELGTHSMHRASLTFRGSATRKSGLCSPPIRLLTDISSPFHAAVGVLTSRILLNMRDNNTDSISFLRNAIGPHVLPSELGDLPPMRFSGGGRSKLTALTGDVRFALDHERSFALDRDTTLVGDAEMMELGKQSLQIHHQSLQLHRVPSMYRDSMYTHGRGGGGSTGSISLDLEFAPNPDAPPQPPQPAPPLEEGAGHDRQYEDAHVSLATRPMAV